jgi:GMP synthase (glutamine-hydrolysing)
MRVLSIVHQADAGPGVFGEELAARGVEHVELLIAEQPEPPADPFSYGAVMTFGGAMNTHDGDDHSWIAREKELLAELLERGTPLLGACLGTQLLAEAAGGSVSRAPEPEIGWQPIRVLPEAEDDPLLRSLAPGFEAFQWHSYLATPPPGSTLLADSPNCPQAYRIGERAWGLQFHAEVTAADADKWIVEWRTDPDAVEMGLDAESLRTETTRKIEGWNKLGRALCGRFLDAAVYSGVT